MDAKFRTAYGPKQRVSISFPATGRTKQAFKEECDINNIMKKFQKTGVLDFVEKRSPQYGDVTGMDFQGAMDTVIKANQMFEDLPSSVRKRFNNDPAEMVDAFQDPSRRSELVELGLVKADVAEVIPGGLPATQPPNPAPAGTGGTVVPGSGAAQPTPPGGATGG